MSEFPTVYFWPQEGEQALAMRFRVFYWPGEYAMDFYVLRVQGLSDKGVALFELASDYRELTHDPIAALIELSGQVKWDGCSNWEVAPNEPNPNLQLHACSIEDAARHGAMMAVVYHLARLSIEKWDHTQEFGYWERFGSVLSLIPPQPPV